MALVIKNSPVNAEDAHWIPESGRSPGEGHSNPLQYACLENPMDRGAWWATVRSVAKSWTRLKQLHTHTFHFTYIYINVQCVYIHIHVYICTHHIFFIHSSSGGHLGYFHISAILNNAFMNIGVLVFFQISVFVFFGCTPRSGILHHTAVLFLVFWGNSTLFSTVIAQIYISNQ